MNSTQFLEQNWVWEVIAARAPGANDTSALGYGFLSRIGSCFWCNQLTWLSEKMTSVKCVTNIRPVTSLR